MIPSIVGIVVKENIVDKIIDEGAFLLLMYALCNPNEPPKKAIIAAVVLDFDVIILSTSCVVWSDDFV